MILRPATPADARSLAVILQDWLDHTPWMPKLHRLAETEAFVAGVIDQGDCRVAGTPALGFLGLQGDEIGQLYVAAEARGKGVGTALIHWAKGLRQTLWLWCFQANAPARAFYAAQGFAEDHRTDGAGNDEKLPDIRFVWRAS